MNYRLNRDVFGALYKLICMTNCLGEDDKQQAKEYLMLLSQPHEITSSLLPLNLREMEFFVKHENNT